MKEAAMLGMFPDMGPSVDDAKFFKSVTPDLAWVQQGHGLWKDLHGIAEVGYIAEDRHERGEQQPAVEFRPDPQRDESAVERDHPAHADTADPRADAQHRHHDFAKP